MIKTLGQRDQERVSTLIRRTRKVEPLRQVIEQAMRVLLLIPMLVIAACGDSQTLPTDTGVMMNTIPTANEPTTQPETAQLPTLTPLVVTNTPTSTPQPSDTPTQTSTSTPQPSNTSTPTPTATSAPTSTPTPEPTGEYQLFFAGLVLNYEPDRWRIDQDNLGHDILVHLSIPNCEIREQGPAEGRVQLTRIKLGEIVYDFAEMSFQDEGVQRGIYIAIEGFEKSDQALGIPFLITTAPLDDLEQCRSQVRQVLATLHNPSAP